MRRILCALAALSLFLSLRVSAQESPAPTDAAQAAANAQRPSNKPVLQEPPRRERGYFYNAEATFLPQHLFPFASPYAGSSSLLSRGETELTQSYTLALKQRVTDDLTWYVMPELALGRGLGDGTGLGDSVNGDLLGQGALRSEPYLARYFIKWHRWFNEQAKTGLSEVPYGPRPNQLLWTAGKISIPDIFDTNAYANAPRTQFVNTAFVNNLALDFGQDTRGYTLGIAGQWVEARWIVRMGVFAMPTAAGGPDLAFGLERNHSAQLELELHPRLSHRLPRPMALRVQAFRNVGNMRNYRDATAALQGGDPALGLPKSDRVKYGFGLNFDTPLADDGDTGMFGRYSWNDGANESMAFAEVDRILSVGAQLSGKRWHRANDVLGIAAAQSDLSQAHRDFLAAGGQGLALGDGRLNYGSEQVLEAYYAYALDSRTTLTLDFQQVNHPGYNRDRGPVSIVGLRLHYALPLESLRRTRSTHAGGADKE